MIIENIAFSGMVTALLCTLLVWSEKRRKNSDYYLMIWLVVCSLGIAYYLFPSFLPDALQSFGFTIPVLSTGMLYLYVISITFNIKFHPQFLVRHALFYFCYNIVFILISVFYEKITFRDSIPYFQTGKNWEVMNFLTYPMAAIPVLYMILCFSALRKYQKLLPEYYAALEKISLNWLKYILISLILLFVVVFCVILAGSGNEGIPASNIFKIIAAIQSVYLFCIVFFSIRQRFIFSSDVIFTDPGPYKREKLKSPEVEEATDHLSRRLLEYMESDRPYLDEELSLLKLSQQLGISTHQLSQVINQNLNTSFYKLVNTYRVEEVKKKLKNPEFDRYSILGIAFESGFNSKSTFNKIFKEDTGMTPSEFKRSGYAGKES